MTNAVPLAPAGPPAIAPGDGALPARAIGVLRSPRRTLSAVADSPSWAPVMALTAGVSFLCGAALLGSETGRLALLDQWERTAIAFGQPVDDATYAALTRASENGVWYAALSALLAGPVLAFACAGLLYLWFKRSSLTRASFRQVLAVVSHAGVILAVRQLVVAPAKYATETLASPTTLSLLFRGLEEASPAARFFGALDLFVVWWAVVLAIGIAVLYRRSARALALVFVGVYVILALVLVLIMVISGGTA